MSGPVWQLKENLKSKRLLIKAYTADKERAEELLTRTMNEIKEYEDVLIKLGEEV